MAQRKRPSSESNPSKRRVVIWGGVVAAMIAVALAVVRFRHRLDEYIDGGDLNTKWFFQIFEALLSVRLADTAEGARVGPVLTVPVSR